MTVRQGGERLAELLEEFSGAVLHTNGVDFIVLRDGVREIYLQVDLLVALPEEEWDGLKRLLKGHNDGG